MTLHYIHSDTPDYEFCTYGNSSLQFRGPPCDLGQPYLAYLGGAETFGRFMETPFPQMVSQRTGLGCLNLAAVNGGVDYCMNAPETFDWINGAQAAVIEVMGAANLSNAFFKVHPRRNDRVVCTHGILTDMFKDTDFVNVHFIRHLLAELEKADPEEYQGVCQVLKTTWVARMSGLLARIKVPVHLVWMADHSPVHVGFGSAASDPFLIDQNLVDAILPKVDCLIVADAPTQQRADPTLRFGEFDQAAAGNMLGKAVHRDVANQICTKLDWGMKKARHA